jgi:hypothetical protein
MEKYRNKKKRKIKRKTGRKIKEKYYKQKTEHNINHLDYTVDLYVFK